MITRILLLIQYSQYFLKDKLGIYQNINPFDIELVKLQEYQKENENNLFNLIDKQILILPNFFFPKWYHGVPYTIAQKSMIDCCRNVYQNQKIDYCKGKFVNTYHSFNDYATIKTQPI